MPSFIDTKHLSDFCCSNIISSAGKPWGIWIGDSKYKYGWLLVIASTRSAPDC
jgi:hypothetical protein